jgi:hypothetical protein
MRLNKLMALVPLTDELLSDTSALNSYLPNLMSRLDPLEDERGVHVRHAAPASRWACSRSRPERDRRQGIRPGRV